ncbi:MAG: hypothetical protein IPL61_08935 [Myxococcales bacterium]|nr:hypothetical protein [Myxococcales bacterium]
MIRWSATCLGALALAACVDTPTAPELGATTAAVTAPTVAIERTLVRGDVAHTTFTVTMGAGPNARFRVHRLVRERGPGWVRPTRGGVMFLHGDFSSFGSSFAPITLDPAASPGLGVWLAERGFDVWGIDRRWATTPLDGDLSDFGDLGLVQALDDTDRGLALARTIRLVTGAGGGRLHLAGFSRGGLIAYAAAARDAARPPLVRQIRGLIALDVWGELPPEAADVRAATCAGAAFEYELLADGWTDSDNSFVQLLGERARTAPDEPFPFIPEWTARETLYHFGGQTFEVFAPTPHYHLAAAALVDGAPVGFTESPEPVIATWFETAPPHQAMREVADTDALWCGDGSGPFDLDLGAIEVPVLYLGAAGGYGDAGLHTTTLVGATDVTTLVVRHQPVGQEARDVGHGDLLFGVDAPTEAWAPLAQWLGAR